MANRLKSRSEYPPGGFQFLQPQTGWQATPGSFLTVVQQVINHRRANPGITKQYNLSTDISEVEIEVEEFNAARCIAHGWTTFVADAPAPPSFRIPHQPRRPLGAAVAGVSKAKAGVALMIDWLGQGLKPIEQNEAQARADICLQCPENQDGGFFQKIDAVAAQQVKKLVEIKNDLKLSVKGEENLKSCLKCDCWNPLSVFAPMDMVLKHISPEVLKTVPTKCWKVTKQNETQINLLQGQAGIVNADGRTNP